MLTKLCGLRLYMVTRKFLHSSLSMNFGILLSSQWCFFTCEMMILNMHVNHVDFYEFGCSI
jgi:hypothetical protein